MSLITSIFWRSVTPGDFFNIERTLAAGPTGGGGQLYIDIPLGGGISLEEFGNFVGGQPLDPDDSNWTPFQVQVSSVSAPTTFVPLALTPRRGKNRRYRIANQNRQAAGGSRHPAWSTEGGFPRAPDDVSSPRDTRMPNLSLLKIFIARTDVGELIAGYTNSATMPVSWPPNVGLEVLFRQNAKVRADGIIHLPPALQFTAAHLIALIQPSRAQIVRRSRSGTRRVRKGKGAGTGSGVTRPVLKEAITVAAPQALEAEDWVESRLRQTYPDRLIWRIGHTKEEFVPLDDGELPGADLIVLDPQTQSRERFVEVKSAVASFPSAIRLTASELRRAKQCAADKLPFDIWVVVFGDSTTKASVIRDFEQEAVRLTIDDLVGVEIQITPQGRGATAPPAP